MIFAYFYTDKLINYLLSSSVNMVSMLIISRKKEYKKMKFSKKNLFTPKCVSLYTFYIDFILFYFAVV